MSGPSAAEDYGAVADADITDITSDMRNAAILRGLKNNDPNLLSKLWVGGGTDPRHGSRYVIEDERGMGALGYYLGRCTNVTDLRIALPEEVDRSTVEPFFGGLARNRSIGEVWLMNSHIPVDFFRMLTPFFKANPNLVSLVVQTCPMDVDQYRSLSLVLREGRSLKHFVIGDLVEGGRYDHEQSILANIEALKMHPLLEKIALYGFTMGRNVCAALSDLLRQTATGGIKLLGLSLLRNGIDDLGVEALVEGLMHSRGLSELYLTENPSITADGWRALAALLESSSSSLQVLSLTNSIRGEDIPIIANALAHNNTLTKLYLDKNDGITSAGWKAFSKVLCDTTSVDSTFLSNHTLWNICLIGGDVPGDVAPLLHLNQDDDKKAVAMKKILFYHDDLDMQPLFEWDLKVLPVVVEWLERAAANEVEYEGDNGNRKLAAIYQFVRGMPELAIEGITGINKKSVGGKRRVLSCL